MRGFRVIVCGSRHWRNVELIAAYLTTLSRDHPDLVVIHGGARGADTIAGALAEGADIPVEIYPAAWDQHGRAAGPRRNREMLAAGVDEVLAFRVTPLAPSPGTDHMVRIARDAGVPVRVVHQVETAVRP